MNTYESDKELRNKILGEEIVRTIEDRLAWVNFMRSLPKEGAKADGHKYQDQQESL